MDEDVAGGRELDTCSNGVGLGRGAEDVRIVRLAFSGGGGGAVVPTLSRIVISCHHRINLSFSIGDDGRVVFHQPDLPPVHHVPRENAPSCPSDPTNHPRSEITPPVDILLQSCLSPLVYTSYSPDHSNPPAPYRTCNAHAGAEYSVVTFINGQTPWCKKWWRRLFSHVILL